MENEKRIQAWQLDPPGNERQKAAVFSLPYAHPQLLSRSMDLRTRPPRSPRVRLGGFVHLPRLLDKARAHLSGTLGDYSWNCPLDKRFFAFTGIDAEALLDQIRLGSSDTQVLAWIRSKLPTQVHDSAIVAWSHWMENLAPGDAARHQGFADTLKAIAPDRDDIRTTFDRLDLDDYVSYGGKP
jgi:hypothetical protein